MRTFKILFFCLFLSSFSGFSQGGYRQNNYGGVNNRDHESTKPSAEEIEKYKAKQLDKIMETLKTDLALDELQLIAIRNEIASNRKSIDIVMSKEEDSEEDKKAEIKALMDKSETTINSYLNKVQKEKYKVLQEENASGKKNKKSKKEDKPTGE